MPYIKYSEQLDNWDPSLLNGYEEHFKQKLENLKIINETKELEKMKEAKQWSETINGKKVILKADDIAKAATQKITGYTGDINTLYDKTIRAIKNSEIQSDEAYRTAAQKIVAGIQMGSFEGREFTIKLNSSDALDLEKAAESTEVKIRGGLSNSIGDVGEGVSALAASSLVETIIEKFEKELPNSIKRDSVKATYTNMGGKFIGKYRSQTDNVLDIEFELNPAVTGGKVSTLHYRFNISDKANKQLAKLSNRTKSTGRLKIRNSTVNAQMEGLKKEALYNTISYHKNDKDERYSGMHSGAGNALRAYMGYKLVLKTFLLSKKYEDEIDFTIYGNRIIPESSIVSKIMGTTKGKNNSQGHVHYLADIRYYQLLKKQNNIYVSAVKTVEEAEEVIRKMPVSLSESFEI